jgi:hypothetical protein
MWRHCNNQEVFCWQSEFALDTEQLGDSHGRWRCNVGTSVNDDALRGHPHPLWVTKGQHMFRQARRAAFALCAIALLAPACAAACSEHTFDPCPEPQSGYDLEVDQRTGRTWLKESRAAITDTSTLGRLSAAARKLPAGSLDKTAAEQRAGEWQTQVKPQR